MNVPLGLGDSGKLVYAYVTYIFMNCIVYTIYGISNTALLPLMTHDPEESTMLATFSAVGNNLIGLIAGSAITPLVLNFGWKVSSVVLGAAACVLILFSALLNKEVDVEEDGPVKETLPMSQQLPAVLKNRYFWLLLLIGAVLLIVGFVITGIAGNNTTVIIVGTVVRSLGAGPLLSAVFALVPDVVDYGYWKFGIHSEGLISSAQSIGSKVGIGLGSAMTGWILAAVGYTPGTEASEAVMNAIRFDYTWLGAILGVVILIIVLMLNVEKHASAYQVAER